MNHWQAEYKKAREACSRGALIEAIEAFEAAIRINPEAFEPHYDLGVILFQQGKFDQALVNFQNVTKLNHRMAPAWLNGGNTLCAMYRHTEGISWYDRAIELDPACVEAHYNLANAYKALEMPAEAIIHYQHALSIDPGMPEAHNNMGTLILGNGDLEHARSCFQLAIQCDDMYVQAIYNLGLVLNRMGRPGEAVAYAKRCLELQPQKGEAIALLVSLLQQTCDWEALSRVEDQLDQLTDAQLKAGQRPSESPFLNFTRRADPQNNLLISRAWSHWLLQQNSHRRPDWEYSLKHETERRIKVAYLSERFRNAATAHLASGIFRRHDRRRFEIYAYSWGQDDGSFYRRSIENGVDHFVDIRTLSDLQAAKRIHSDGIDILVDMMGWMHGHRMGISSLRPAPVQVSYLGYPGTTGAPYIDYLLADKAVIPDEMRRNYSETVIWMPDCYQPNDPDTPIDPLLCERMAFGLPEQAFVFCSFNTDYKIEPKMFECWMSIMRSVPNSVLWLIVRSEEARENLCRSATAKGVDPNRIVFASPLTKPKHIARMRLADVALDTLPVNGHTTTTDALLAGVPVITCKGRHFASRVAASILKAIGMNDLVTSDMQNYENLAVSLARDPNLLTEVKTRLAQNRERYPLFDINRYVKNLEAAFESMWQAFKNEALRR